MKKMTAKKKAAKRKPRTWVRWAIVERNGNFWTTAPTRFAASTWGCPGDEYVRVRITEIVK